LMQWLAFLIQKLTLPCKPSPNQRRVYVYFIQK
jgi:hypothetical protein